LLGRLEKKALLLMRTYTGRPEKLLAVATAALGIARRMQLLGSEATAIMVLIPGWWEASIDPLVNDVIEKHDYSKADTVWWVARSASLLGAAVTAEQVQRKMEGALTFGLEAQLNVHWPAQDWLLVSTFAMQHHAFDAGKDFLTGKGTGEYVSFTSPDSMSTQAPAFPVAATLRNFDACAGTADLTIDRFYADAETYQIEDDDPPPPFTMSLVKESFERMFAKYLKDGVYTLPVQVRNLDPRMVDQTIEVTSTAGKVRAEFDIVLTHTPKLVK
jgi:hypothetical protein